MRLAKLLVGAAPERPGWRASNVVIAGLQKKEDLGSEPGIFLNTVRVDAQLTLLRKRSTASGARPVGSHSQTFDWEL
jgi:hypothetical protein